MTRDKITLTDEKETLFIPLYGKAVDYRSKNTILNDSTANDIVESVGVNFTKHKRFGGRIFSVRARQYDEWARDFMAKNENALVLHLGCGLDARIIRVQPPLSIMWFDVDYPEVISLRKQFYSETHSYRMTASSLTDQDWLKTTPSDRPVLVIAEGVFEYLSEEEVKTLLNSLTDYFSNGQMVFDVMNLSAKKRGNKHLKKATGSTTILKWTVDDINDVARLNPRLKSAEVIPLIKSGFNRKLPFWFRFILLLSGLSSKQRNGMRLLRYDF